MSYNACRLCGNNARNEICGRCKRKFPRRFEGRGPNRLKDGRHDTIVFPHSHHGHEPSIGDRLARGFRALRGD